MAIVSTRRLSVVALAALMASLAAPDAWSQDVAAPAGAPFAGVYQLADAKLEQLRGGYQTFDSKVVVPFAVDISFASFKDGQKISWFDASNHGKGGTVRVMSDNVNFGPINQVTGPLGTSVSTSVTAGGIVTMVQNTRPNITLQTLQTLNIDISGLVRSAAQRSARPFSIFH